ncbi:MAG TPA: hypothetical protein VJY39_02985 [Acidisphaera sp.]|nr:hypothetical protein [Acidisphaera sp.]HME27650.1 hypothetical protein [Acetobacteraceae bacterium]
MTVCDPGRFGPGSRQPLLAADSAGSTVPEAVLGIVSLILWSPILIMRASSHGDGVIAGSWRTRRR